MILIIYNNKLFKHKYLIITIIIIILFDAVDNVSKQLHSYTCNDSYLKYVIKNVYNMKTNDVILIFIFHKRLSILLKIVISKHFRNNDRNLL